jgi:hypothetical protein
MIEGLPGGTCIGGTPIEYRANTLDWRQIKDSLHR